MAVPTELRQKLEARYSGKVLKDALIFLDVYGASEKDLTPAQVAEMGRKVEDSLSRVLEEMLGKGVAGKILDLSRSKKSQDVYDNLFGFVEYWKGLLGMIEYVSGIAGMNMINSLLEERLRGR
ncbi:MAG: hypothetical protein HY558_04890 [Euryarchaeota archaeon]|nr:hypothetical protein [Euryarchaeota archaeon]